MGCPDSISAPCPKCSTIHWFQSKGGECTLSDYTLQTAPLDVLSDVNRHSPYECERCHTVFFVNVLTRTSQIFDADTDRDSIRW